MAKENRVFVTAVGRLNDVIAKLAKAVYAKGGNDEDILRIISNETLCEEIAKLLVGTKTLARIIGDCEFSHVNPGINEQNFLFVGSSADAADMLTVSQEDLGGENMTTVEIESAINRKGFRPATIAEQLAYARVKWNGRDMVVALGSSWVLPSGRRSVPYLCEGDDGRRLRLFLADPENRWREGCLFLVVRK